MLRSRNHPFCGRYAARILFLGCMLMLGCSTVPNSALESARKIYEMAVQDSKVSANAPVALYEAEKTLREAERLWERNGERAEIEHLAYLAKRRVEIARAMAEQKIAENEAQRLSQEREKVLLEARSRLAVHALQEAEDRARKASEARQEAETKSREAALARKQAEERAQEAVRARKDAEEAISKAKQLEEQLAQLKAEHTDRGLVLNLGDVLFEFGKAELKPGVIRNLAPLVTFLKKYPTRNVLIEGHTDSIGSESANLELSRRRADAVGNFLLQNGIGAERITARGYGEAFPLAPNDNEVGRQKNRRVEVVILREGESADHRVRTTK